MQAEKEKMDEKNPCAAAGQSEQPPVPPELGNRKVYNTPIGPVCMSKTEHEAYLEELEWRKIKNRTHHPCT